MTTIETPMTPATRTTQRHDPAPHPDPSVHLLREAPMTHSTLTTHVPVDVEPREPDSPCSPTVVDDAPASTRRPVARCADGNGSLTALFFSDHVADIARAKAMCGLCPLRVSCLEGALQREEPWGVWGGELLSGGRVIANKRPCGRPPKHPRPEVLYDELGPIEVA